MSHSCLRALLLSLFVIPSTLLFNLIPCVAGNTEIVNFAASLAESPSMTFPEWIQLTPSNKKVLLDLQPVLHSTEVSSESGVWLILDLDDPGWNGYDKFTLRASWPASHPCDIHLKIFDPLLVAGQLVRNRPLHSTRKKYAHVYAINTGVPTPSWSGEDMSWLRRLPVPITVVLEPLLFGIIPLSVVPVILVLLVAIGIAIVLLPYITGYLDRDIKKIQQKSKEE